MKITQKLAVLLVFCILLSSVSLSISKDGKAEFFSAAEAATGVDGTVAGSPYVTSGSARPQVLSNGWIVTAAYYDNERKIVINVSKDKGATWSELCNIGNGTVYSADALASGNFSMTSNGTNVYILSWRFSSSGSKGTICCWKFDAATQANTNIYSSKRDIEEQITIGQGCYIAADSNGVLHAVWNSRNSNYLGGFNIRYGKSTDGGATWSAPTQMTTNSESYVNWTNPTIVIRKDNSPCIYAQHANTGASWNAIAFWYWRKDTNDWNYKGMASSAYISYSSYLHTFPSATVTEDGVIHVVWQGTYPGNTNYNNIFYSKSTDGGITWTTSIRLTELTYEQARPCITTDGSKIFVYWYGNNNTGKYQIYRKVFNGSWGAVEKITNNTTADACLPSAVDNFKQFSEPLIIYQDNEAKIVRFKAEYPNNPMLNIDRTASTSGAIYLPISGTVSDADEGEIITIKYKIDNGNIITLPDAITSDGNIKDLTGMKIDISQLSDGRHVLDIWAEDSNGGISSVETIVFTRNRNFYIVEEALGSAYAALKLVDLGQESKKYQLKCNNKYISAAGRLTETPQWLDKDLNSTGTAILVTGLKPDTSYSFSADAYDEAGVQTGNSFTMDIVTKSKALSVPAGLNASIGTDKIVFSWDAVEGADQYQVEADGIISSTASRQFTHTGIDLTKKHTYRVRAQNSKSSGSWSSYVNVNDVKSYYYNRYSVSGPYSLQYVDKTTYGGYENIGYQSYTFNDKTGEIALQSKVNLAGACQYYLSGGYLCFSNGGIDMYNNYFTIRERWRVVNSGETKGTLLQQNIIAPDGTYPGNGKHTDGYWYVRGTVANANPVFTATQPLENEMYSTFIPLEGIVMDSDTGDVLTLKYSIDAGTEKVAEEAIISKGVSQAFSTKYIDISTLKVGAHQLKISVTDNKGGASEMTISFMKYVSPGLSIKKQSATYMDFAIYDYDPQNIQYQLICNGKYVSEEGKITDIPTWLGRSGNEFTLTEVSIKGLEAKTEYNVQLRARNISGAETVAFGTVKCITDVTKLYTPGNLSAKASNDSITLYWNPVAEAHEYEIEADGRVTTTSALSYTFKGLAPKTSHVYRIRAKNTDSASEWSSLLKLSTKTQLPEIPQNIKVTALGTGIAVSWDKVNAALGYEVEFDGTIMKTYNTELTIKGLKPDTQHTYRLRPLGVSGSGLWSDIYTVRTTNGIIGDVPRNITSKVTNTTITLLWEPVGDAEGYDIAPVSPDGTPGTAIDNGKLPTCEIRGLTPNASYAYVIRAKNSGGCGPWSSVISVGTCLLGTPGNIQTAESDTSILFTWEPVPLAQGYELKINNITNAADISGASFSLTGLVPGTEYRYSLRAKGSGGNGGWSEEKSVFTVPQKPSVPANVNATVSDTKINIAWTALADTSIVGYDVELDGVVLENDTETAYIHEGLAPYSLHTYRVRARNELVEGEWSTASSIRTLPSKPQVPEGIIIKSTQTGATLTWQPELGASGYDLYIFRLDEDGTEIPVGEITDIAKTSYTHRRQIKGEEYRYRLRTRNVHGLSPWSGDIINNAIKAQCKKGNTLDLGLTATDVVDFGSYEMVVTYNPGVVEVADLSTLTGAAELTAGKIEGTGITIKEFSPGRIVFVVDKAVTPGEAWTGVINGIKFKARETGGTTITYTVFTRQE